MKIKRLFFYIITITLVVCIILLSLLICFKHYNHKDYGLALGNSIDEKLTIDCKYDASFTNPNMSSTYLQKMIEMDASKIIDGKIVKLSTLIKQSTFIIINLGSYDLTSKVKINTFNNTIIYDEDIINRQLNTTLSIIDLIVDSLRNINSNTTIYLLIQKYPFTIYDNKLENYFLSLNDGLNDISKNKKIEIIQ